MRSSAPNPAAESAAEAPAALPEPSVLVLRGGAVLRRGGAILLPAGESRAGTSRLVAALVRAGAELLADGEIRLDDQGRVLVAADTPAAAAAPDPVEIALIVATSFHEGARWQPEARRGARAALPILGRATFASGSLRRMLHLAARLAPRLTTLSGPRPEADEVAPRILAFLDEMLDGPSTEPAPAAETDAAGGVAPLAPGCADDAVELLRRHPAILLLHWHGRFGNRMHQYAYGVTHARLTGRRFWLPSQWEGTHLFEAQSHSVLPQGRLRTNLNRSADGDPPEVRLRALRAVVPEAIQIRARDPRQNYAQATSPVVAFDDMCAYHPSIFASMSAAHLRAVFAFSAKVRGLDLYKRLEDRQGTYDIAHLRRDDISNARYNQTHYQGYSVISQRSYEAAFARFGFDPAAIEWVSDDYTGKWHTDRPQRPRGRWLYPAGSEVLPDVLFDWLEDFLRLYFARTIFRANSSFSWWAAFLAPSARVFSPVIDKRHIYGVDGLEEIDVEFVEGNHPHWMFGNADIRLGA